MLNQIRDESKERTCFASADDSRLVCYWQEMRVYLLVTPTPLRWGPKSRSCKTHPYNGGASCRTALDNSWSHRSAAQLTPWSPCLTGCTQAAFAWRKYRSETDFVAAWFSGRLGSETSSFPVSFAAFASFEAKCERANRIASIRPNSTLRFQWGLELFG